MSDGRSEPQSQAGPRSYKQSAEPAAHGDASLAEPPPATPPADYLTMRLRDFLHSAETNGGAAIPFTIPEEVTVTVGHGPARASLASARAPPGYVWVDCYFYGFFMEETKAREAGMLQPDAASSSSTAVHVPAVVAC